MVSDKLPRCPYCGLRANYFNTFFLKNKNVYYCPSCNSISSVKLKPMLYKNIWITEIISIIIVVLYFLFADKKSLLGIFLVIIPFVIFYTFVPFFIDLRKIKITGKSKK